MNRRNVARQVRARAGATGRTVSEIIESAVRDALRLRPRASAPLPPLPTFGGSSVVPGVSPADAAALRDVMEDGVSLDALR